MVFVDIFIIIIYECVDIVSFNSPIADSQPIYI